jgi:hypothetical protein
MLPELGRVSFKAAAPKAYFDSLSELIQRHPFDPPDGFRIYHIDDEEAARRKYESVNKLASLLSQVAVSADRKGWILWAKDRLIIEKNYSADDLRMVEGVEDMREKLSAGENLSGRDKRMLDIYQALFVHSVNEVLTSIPPEKRLPHLIKQFPECVFRFKLAFRCFADDASEALKRYEDNRAGMIAGLNGVLGNIQTALIGIPLAGLLALKEMKPSDGMNYENVIVAGAVLVVGALLLALSLSQGKTLKAIEIQRNQLTREMGELGGRIQKIDELLSSMTDHHSLVRTLLYFVRVIIVAFMLIALVALVYRCGFISEWFSAKKQ